MSELLPLSATAEPPGPVLAGFSGGLDSTVLLHLLAGQDATRARGLRAIHVQHGLHPDAGAWAIHCRQFCQTLGVELLVVAVDVPRSLGLGLEAAARQARYEAFSTHLRHGETLALAHHQDDQAETVMLRLLRASGSDGLAAMREWRAFASGWLWRPLLERPRAELLAYAGRHGLNWIEDPSNAEHGPDRNFLRHRVLPDLRQRWPGAQAALARSAALLAEDAELLGAEARKRLELARGPAGDILMVDGLLEMERPWRFRALREWIGSLRLPALPGDALPVIDSQLLDAAVDATAEYRWAGTVIRRWRNWLHVEPWREALPEGWTSPWDGATALVLPTGDSLSFEREPEASAAVAGTRTAVVPPLGPMQASARQGGERIRLPGREHSHSLKHCLQEAAVPPWERRRLPLLYAADGELLAAGDRILSARLADACAEQSLRLRWRQPRGASFD